jgi:serine protease Do
VSAIGLDDSMVAVAAGLRRVTARVIDGDRPSHGAGVVWTGDGVIVTNAHVARRHATVVLADGRRFAARIEACDVRSDLAALRIDASVQPADVGDSDRLRVGDLVLAVGHPFGLSGALTTGLVHALGPHDGLAPARFIHAAVRLAPGNSGGPLADASGRVIGVNSMVVGGLALAVPSNVVVDFLRRARVIRDGSPLL